jgi:hypothetical protein
MFRVSLIVGLLLGAIAAAAAESYYSNPARDIEFSNVQHLGRSPRILIPTLYVKFARWGRVPLSIEGGATEGSVVDVDAPVDVVQLREMAARLHEDLKQNLEKAGWDVLTATDVQDKAAWTKLERAKADRRFGVPFEQGTAGGNPRRYLIVAPGELPVIEAGATGPAWALKDLVTELNATVLVPMYTFDVIPSVSGDAASSLTPVAPRLQLLDVNFDFRTPGMVGGTIRAKVPQTSNDTTGSFVVPGVKEDRLLQALQDTAAGKGKGELMLETDTQSLIATAIAVGGGFNSQVVNTIAAFAPK